VTAAHCHHTDGAQYTMASELTYRYGASWGVLPPSVWVMEVCVSTDLIRGRAARALPAETELCIITTELNTQKNCLAPNQSPPLHP
jgi:hypothetical protein